jgi:hypothetical protein
VDDGLSAADGQRVAQCEQAELFNLIAEATLASVELGSVSFEQALNGLPHQLAVAQETRFEQVLDLLIAGRDAL